MSFDEFCLEQLPSDDTVFYLWRNSPSVIVGLNQNVFAEVNVGYLEENGIKLARRMTGGGAVYHDLQNLNYTITGRSRDLDRDCPGYLHLMLDALKTLGVKAEMTGRNDIVVEGRKVSGYAKRVYKDRVMIHGTLMYDVDMVRLTECLTVPGSKLEAAGIASVRSRVANLRDYLPQLSCIEEFQAELESILSRNYYDPQVVLTAAQEASVREMCETRFSTWEWNYGRSPKAQLRQSRRLPCGTVEACCNIVRGRLAGVCFGGDFIGNLPAEGLAAALEGCLYERSAVMAVLVSSDTGKYFDRTSPEQIAGLFFS